MAAAATAQLEQLVEQLLREGTLDAQFQDLLKLQDDGAPDFVQEVIELYFEDSGAKIDRIGEMLSVPAPNFHELDALVHQFKGSSASLGAQVIAQLCIRLREQCQAGNTLGCQALQQQIKAAYADLQQKLQVFMALEAQRKQLLAAGMG